VTADRDRYRLSFDTVAEAYERSRPQYTPEGLAWIAERLPLHRVLDLGAGTGKLTRQLAALGADVVAVEPGAEMRAVFRRVLPGVELLDGSAEAIPLANESVDAVAVGQAFHWFRLDEALREMHRVLRPGGGYALLWNEWDDEDSRMHALNDVVQALRPHRDVVEWARETLEQSTLFRDFEERTFRHAEELPAAVVVERVSSVSAVAAAEPGERERALAKVRGLVGTGTVHFPMITTILVADRA
jgi:ubiquinone/menaquinone biosynthesis C-methylase UbiE